MNSDHVITTHPTRAVQAAELDRPSLAELEAVEGGRSCSGVIRFDTTQHWIQDTVKMVQAIVYGCP
jgi:hypothetical protein